MGNVNRKISKDEKSKIIKIINGAFPQYEVVWGAHGDYGGHRAPRDHTISFRLRDKNGKFHSNIVWLSPDGASTLTVSEVIKLVKINNGE